MNNRITEAIESGNISEITNLIENEKVNPNIRFGANQILPLELAIESKQIEAFKTLIKLGAEIKIDNRVYKNSPFDYERGCNWFWYIFIKSKEIDLLLPYIIKDGLSQFKMDVLLKNPIQKFHDHGGYIETKTCKSILDVILSNGSIQNKLIIINYILVYYIQKEKNNCTSPVELMEKTKNNLECILQNSFYYKEYDVEAETLIKNQIDLMEKCVQVTQTLFTRYDESDMNLHLLPLEIRHKITYETFLASFAALSNKLIEEIANTFITLASLEDNKMKEIKIDKISKLAFREWRQNHLSLFYQQRPNKSFLKDYYDCLKECLSKIDLFPLPLRERIISGLGKLDLTDVNRPGIIKTVEHAVNPKI
jgi:hypothetical protein